MTKKISRREFIQYITLALGVLNFADTATITQIQQHIKNLTPQTPNITSFYDNLSPEELYEHTKATFMAVVDSIVGDDKGSIQHYGDFFDFKVKKFPDYLEVYTLFAVTLDLITEDWDGTKYRDNTRNIRYAILQGGMSVASPDSEYHTPQPKQETAADEIWMQFNQKIIAEFFRVFFETNALIMIGYDGWSGLPRGLENYIQPA